MSRLSLVLVLALPACAPVTAADPGEVPVVDTEDTVPAEPVVTVDTDASEPPEEAPVADTGLDAPLPSVSNTDVAGFFQAHAPKVGCNFVSFDETVVSLDPHGSTSVMLRDGQVQIVCVARGNALACDGVEGGTPRLQLDHGLVCAWPSTMSLTLTGVSPSGFDAELIFQAETGRGDPRCADALPACSSTATARFERLDVDSASLSRLMDQAAR